MARRSGSRPRSTPPKSSGKSDERPRQPAIARTLPFSAPPRSAGWHGYSCIRLLSGEKKAEQRRASFARTEPVARQAEKSQRTRREQVEGSLKEVEERRLKQKNIALTSRHHPGRAVLVETEIPCRIRPAGRRRLCHSLGARRRADRAPSACAFAAGFGLPRWTLNFLKKRREKAVPARASGCR